MNMIGTSRKYIVKRGDTLRGIASSCLNKSDAFTEIATLNHLHHPDKIYPGQLLDLPIYEKNRYTPPLRLEINNNACIVNYGDTLWSLSGKHLGSHQRWKELAKLNNLSDSDLIYVGQNLQLPTRSHRKKESFQTSTTITTSNSFSPQHRSATMVPARAFFFVVADEFNPFSKKYVRKVIFPEKIQDNIELVKQIMNPEKYGFSPRDPHSKLPIGRHVLGRTDSNYISVSKRPLGSPRFKGKSYWIDVKKLEEAGAAIYDASEIVADLDRIAKKTKKPEALDEIKNILQKSTVIDKEVLIEGPIKPGAIKGAFGKSLTHGIQFVEGIGIILTVYDMEQAAITSYNNSTPRPLIAETVRQVGGWGGAFAGCGVGATAGAAFGIETGPGAILTAGIGGAIGGIAGYFGADWIANYIHDKG